MTNLNNPWGGFALPPTPVTTLTPPPFPAPVLPPTMAQPQPMVEPIKATLRRHGLAVFDPAACGGDPEIRLPRSQIVFACPTCGESSLSIVQLENLCLANEADEFQCSEAAMFMACSNPDCKGIHAVNIGTNECGLVGLSVRPLSKQALLKNTLETLAALTPRSDTPIRRAVVVCCGNEVEVFPSIAEAAKQLGIPYHQVRAVLLRGGGDLPATLDNRKYAVRWAAPALKAA